MKTLQITILTHEYCVNYGYKNISDFIKNEQCTCYSKNENIDFSIFDNFDIAEYTHQKQYIQNFVNCLEPVDTVYISYGPVIVPSNGFFINVIQELSIE